MDDDLPMVEEPTQWITNNQQPMVQLLMIMMVGFSIECLVQYQHQLRFMNLVDGHQYQYVLPKPVMP